MKTTFDNKITSTLTGDAYAMTFDADGTAHIMSILSNIYSNAPLAVLREYSANALDSHIEAGNTAPIEIKLPSVWDNNLIIKDYGVGLSEEEIIEVYASYGKSTKRDTNDQVGAFGIGAKSAFTIGSQFVVTGVKDGKRTVALFALNEKNIGTVTIVSRKETDEPNGVTVSIAIDEKHDVFRSTAADLFSTWPKGSVLVDGKEPKSAFDDLLKVTDNVYVSTDNTQHCINVVMGGISYKYSGDMYYGLKKHTEQAWHVYNGLSITAIVPMGAVDITPSREDLRDTEKTIKVLTRILGEYTENISRVVKDLIKDSSSAFEAAVNAQKYTFLLPQYKNVTWNGIDLFKSIEFDMPNVYFPYGHRGRGSRLSDKVTLLPRKNWDNIIVITGVDLDKRTDYVKRNAKRFVNSLSLALNDARVLISDKDKFSHEWFSFGDNDIIKTVPFTEFRQFVIDNRTYTSTAPSRPNNKEISYQCSDLNFRTVEEINKFKNVYFDSYNCWSTSKLDNIILQSDSVLILLSGRQKPDVLRKRVPKARPYDEVKKLKAQEILDNLTDDDRLLLSFHYNSTASTVADIAIKCGDHNLFGPEIAEYIRLNQAQSSDKAKLINTAFRTVNRGMNPETKSYQKAAYSVYDKYPLLKNIYGSANIKHIKLYIEAVNKEEN